MKRAVITNAYSAKNAGDAAIMLATAELLRSLGFTDIRLASRYADEDRDFYAAYGLRTVPPAIAFPVRGGMSSPARAARLLASMAVVSLLCVLNRV